MITLRNSILCIAINLCCVGNVAANDPFAELDHEVSQLSVDDSKEFNQWYAAHISEFTQWQIAYLEDWDKQQQDSISRWGDAKTSSQDLIVVVDNKSHSRTVIDLKNNQITIDIKPNESTVNKQQQLDSINNVIASNQELLTSIGLTTPITAKPDATKVIDVKLNSDVINHVQNTIKAQTERQMSQLDIYSEQSEVLTDEVIKEQVITEQKHVMKAHELERVAKLEDNFKKNQQTLARAPIKLVQYRVDIPTSTISERAKNYMPYIYVESVKQNLPAPLILAIMHTESHFNPKAKSHVPAFGLMQIVPNTAGHDVNKLYRGKDRPMSANELYNPQVNIETGTAYLKILKSRYLKGIKDPQSATYAVIAAYNTGSGNIAKAFGLKSVNMTVKKINTMSSQQVYQHLITNLPYKETRNYLEKVNSKLKQYSEKNKSSTI